MNPLLVTTTADSRIAAIPIVKHNSLWMLELAMKADRYTVSIWPVRITDHSAPMKHSWTLDEVQRNQICNCLSLETHLNPEISISLRIAKSIYSHLDVKISVVMDAGVEINTLEYTAEIPASYFEYIFNHRVNAK